jgi:hypothetical protein
MGWGSRGTLPVGSAEVVTGRYNSPSHQPSRFSTVQDRREWKGGGEEIREGTC